MKQLIAVKGANMISIIAKINEKAKNSPNPKTYTSKKLQLKKGNYPNEHSLLNGVIFTVLNSDEIYTPHGQCLVIMPPDLPDSDDLIIYLIIERAKNKQKVFDLNKKSDIQVQLFQCELSFRADYILPKAPLKMPELKIDKSKGFKEI
jgi:hypothetical protein